MNSKKGKITDYGSMTFESVGVFGSASFTIFMGTAIILAVFDGQNWAYTYFKFLNLFDCH